MNTETKKNLLKIKLSIKGKVNESKRRASAPQKVMQEMNISYRNAKMTLGFLNVLKRLAIDYSLLMSPKV